MNPNQYIESDDSFTKMSHELRFISPADKRVRLVGGLFYQRQTHNIEQNYIIDNIADAITVPGTDSNIWLTKQLRTDRDYAAFGEVTFDITPTLTATAGGRFYKYDNTLLGFFGYSAGYSSRTGVAACFGPAEVDGSPCTNLDKRGEISKSVQCNESICGDAGNDTDRGGKIYTTITRPRTIGVRLGRTF